MGVGTRSYVKNCVLIWVMSRNWPCVMKSQEEQSLRKIYMIIYLLFSSSLVLVNTKIIGKRCFQPIFVNYRQYTNANYYQNSIVWNKWAICLLKRESQTKFARRTRTLSETQYDWRKIEPVTMKANFIHFWCVESEFIVKN